jgi:hypothetical protein
LKSELRMPPHADPAVFVGMCYPETGNPVREHEYAHKLQGALKAVSRSCRSEHRPPALRVVEALLG